MYSYLVFEPLGNLRLGQILWKLSEMIEVIAMKTQEFIPKNITTARYPNHIGLSSLNSIWLVLPSFFYLAS